MLKFASALLFVLIIVQPSSAQDYRWQQRAEYTMDVRLDVKTHKVSGSQKLVYFNNSKDTLTKVYYHLYFNTFQPGSMMDVRSRNLPDPDPRVKDRIFNLKENEIGYQHIQSLKQDGKDLGYKVDGTILEVALAKPILPNTKTTFDMKFESQVPLQIRRSGRDSKEGIAYSMTQWYPKMAEYDFQGWHAYQYVAREFHGVWGDFDVKITLDPSFVVAGTGKLVNADKVGYGYEKAGSTVKRPEGDLTWNFVAKNVIDFAWAADPDYTHDKAQVPNGPEVHFFYQKSDKTTENWLKMEGYAVKHFEFMNKTFGKYPYETYSIIQGGDGGMEYPMCTLILGEGSFGSLEGVMSHEVSHSWYQGVLASNESLYPWLDEGYTDFASQESRSALFSTPLAEAHQASYTAYFNLIKRGLQEPISQHSDHYNTNTAYGTAAYAMGTVFLHQLKYVMGEELFYKGMRQYYNTWKFRHPEPNDFIRVMEKVSGLQLGWYLRYWVYTTKKIDYGIQNVVDQDGNTFVTLERLGEFPMPIDLLVTYKDGTKEMFYIPLNETLGNKPVEDKTIPRSDLEAWPWVNPSYTLKVGHKTSDIATIQIDPSQRMADVNTRNNTIDISEGLKAYEDPTQQK
ncbi:M1 family metallopeptidase [Chryseolinea lacunae]|uniref:M1 family metallopeptidase n=1 Tax=Chryseolinea lacunae TaxID=2801331 RepID=A0ABS1KYB5_9BACT|nr:M1 family metallopeptidase [Chryseolinea lacunae]MBL0744399.1 M1 family metallopeptidase [Chryseolinea lacunae]